MPTRSRRLPFWVMIIALVICVLAGVFVLLWFKLPTWAPAWVVEHSPWVDPIIRSVEEEPSLREQGWKRLSGRGGAVAPAMIAYLETDRKEAVTLACWVLRDVVNPDMVVPVMRRLKSRGGHGVTIFDLGNLIEALSKQQAKLVVDALLPIPEGTESETLLLISLAGRMDDPRAIDALRAIIWEPKDSTSNPLKESFGRSAIAVASLANSPVPAAKSWVIQALEDPAAHVRLRAVSGLTSPVGRKPLDAVLSLELAKRLKDDDATVREAAAVAANFNLLPGAEAEMITWLDASDPKKRSTGLTGLGSKHASEAAIGAIAQCIHDPESKVQRSAINALCRTANPLVVPYLLDAYPSLPIKLQKEILTNFKGKGLNQHPEVFPFLLRLMEGQDLEMGNVAEEVVWHLRLTEEQRDLAMATRDALQRRNAQEETKPTAP